MWFDQRGERESQSTTKGGRKTLLGGRQVSASMLGHLKNECGLINVVKGESEHN
jgi:hypothetical protein